MALLFTILSTLLGAGINVTALSGVGLAFNMLRHDGGKERKRHDLAEEQLQRARDKWNKNRMNGLISLIKDYVNKIRQGHISTILMRQCLNTIKYLQKN